MRRSLLEIKLQRYADGTAEDMAAAIEKAMREIRRTIAEASTEPNIGTNAREREAAISEMREDLKHLEAELGKHLRKLTDTAARMAHGEATAELRDAGKTRLVKYDPDRTEAYFKIIAPLNGKNLAAVFTDKLEDRLVRGLRASVVDVMRKAAVEGMSMREQNRAMQEAWAEDSRDGNLFRFVDNAGRSWENARYFQMNARTNAMRVANESRIDTFTENGFKYARISDDHPTECKVCMAWQGRILQVAGDDGTYPTYDDAVEAGMFHPNCTHRLEYIDEDLDKAEFDLQKDFPPPDDMDDEDAMQEVKDGMDAERYVREDGMSEGEAEAEVMRDHLAQSMRAGLVPTEEVERLSDSFTDDEVREIMNGGTPSFEPTKRGEEPTWNHGSAGGVVHYDRDDGVDGIQSLVRDEIYGEDAKPFSEHPTKDEISAIKDYVGVRYAALNVNLIDGNPLTEGQAKLRDDLLNVISKAPEQRMKTWRGESYSEDDKRYRYLLDLEEGDKYKSKAFMSTSLKSSVADDFTKSNDVGVRYTIHGRHGAYIAPYSEMPNEQEVLYKPDAEFGVLQRRIVNGILELVLREL